MTAGVHHDFLHTIGGGEPDWFARECGSSRECAVFSLPFSLAADAGAYGALEIAAFQKENVGGGADEPFDIVRILAALIRHALRSSGYGFEKLAASLALSAQDALKMAGMDAHPHGKGPRGNLAMLEILPDDGGFEDHDAAGPFPVSMAARSSCWARWLSRMQVAA
jgi:hypothetical protein